MKQYRIRKIEMLLLRAKQICSFDREEKKELGIVGGKVHVTTVEEKEANTRSCASDTLY